MWDIFKKKYSSFQFLKTDIHSHLLPEVDDGVQDIQTSLEFMRNLLDLGFEKLVLTPHIYSEYYPNSKLNLEVKFHELCEHVQKADLAISLHLAAEYYIDEHFNDLIHKKELLTFGDNYILVETSFAGLPLFFEETLFKLTAIGLQPILAHPERYRYLQNKLSYFNQLHERGVLLQVNLNSFTGYYGFAAQEMAKYLINEKLISFVGTDLHHEKHVTSLINLFKNTNLSKLLEKQPLRNNQL